MISDLEYMMLSQNANLVLKNAGKTVRRAIDMCNVTAWHWNMSH